MPRLSYYLQQYRTAIVDRFCEEAGKRDAARGMARDELIDTLPEYLDTLTAISLGEPHNPEANKARLEATHISLRLRLGFTQADVLDEYTVLGRIISDTWADRPPEEQPSPEELKLLFDELQAAMQCTVHAFSGQSFADIQNEKRYLRRLDAVALGDVRQSVSAPALHARLGPLLGVVQEAMSADGAMLWLADGDDNRLELAASSGAFSMNDPGPGCALSSGSFCAMVAHSADPVHLPDAQSSDTELGLRLEGTGLRSLLGLRLNPRGRLLGIVAVGVVQVRSFTPNERRRFETVCEHLGGVLEIARLNERLSKSNLDLEGEKAELRRERELREQFVSVLAHDLRGPLSAVKMAAQLLASGRAANTGDLIKRIIRNVDRTDKMLRDLLDASRIRANEKLTLELAECDLSAVVREVVEEMSEQHPGRFEVQDAGDVRGLWSADELRRALWNLLANAINYGAADGQITVTLRPTVDGAELSVHNEGEGIPSEQQKRLFEPFSRNNGADANKRGWGLGLTVVKGCAEAHGGRVEVQSSSTEGTTFTIALPRDARPAQQRSE